MDVISSLGGENLDWSPTIYRARTKMDSLRRFKYSYVVVKEDYRDGTWHKSTYTRSMYVDEGVVYYMRNYIRGVIVASTLDLLSNLKSRGNTWIKNVIIEGFKHSQVKSSKVMGLEDNCQWSRFRSQV